MFCHGLLVLLLGTLAVAQANPPAPQAPASKSQSPVAPQTGAEPEEEEGPPAPASAAKLPLSAPVITVNGLCDKTHAAKSAASESATARKSSGSTSAKSTSNTTTTGPATSSSGAADAGCKTVVTRAEFEKLAQALNPQMPMNVKRQLAQVYPRLLLLAEKAREQGMDKQPGFHEMMRFATLQLLAQSFTREMQQRASNISDADVEKYYKDSPGQFEQLELLRIFVPKSKQHPPEASSSGSTATPAPKPDTAADEAAMKEVSEKIHTRAAAGEDFEKLQKEAFVAAGIASSAPNVNLNKVTRRNLPVNHQKVFDLQPGKVSELISDPGMYYIYKVVSKQTMPLTQAKTEIRTSIQAQRIEDTMESLVRSIKPEMNEAYFGPTRPAAKSASPAKTGAEPKPAEPDKK
jgi:hypothetical protein